MTITPEIEELKNLVEQKYGKILGTSTDFEEFSLHLMRTTQMNVSVSTLKRLWGYVGDSHKPRNITLDALARYIEHKDFHEFTSWLKTSTKYNSSFFNAVQVVSNELKPDTQVIVGWNPNRMVRLRYLGDSRYEVVASANSKLCVSDKFITGCFIKEQPLFIPFIDRAGERTAPFVAGRNGGLTVVSIIEEMP